MGLLLSAALGVAVATAPAPGAAASSAAAAAFPPALARELERVLRAHLASGAREHKGRFLVVDEDQDLTRALEFRRLSPEGARAVGADEGILRGIFSEKEGGRGPADAAVEVDFTLLKTGGRWRVVEEEIYSVGGRPRFSYTDDNQRLPAVSEPPEETEPDAPPD